VERPTDYQTWTVEKQWEWSFQNSSYVYIRAVEKYRDLKQGPAQVVALYEKPTLGNLEIPVAFYDGKVMTLAKEEVARIVLQQTGKPIISSR
jgi:hypothetical protein